MTFYVFQVLDVVIGRPGAWDATRLVYDHFTPCVQGNSTETYLLANRSKGHEYTIHNLPYHKRHSAKKVAQHLANRKLNLRSFSW